MALWRITKSQEIYEMQGRVRGGGGSTLRMIRKMLKLNQFEHIEERKLGTQTPLGFKTIAKKPSDSGFCKRKTELGL